MLTAIPVCCNRNDYMVVNVMFLGGWLLHCEESEHVDVSLVVVQPVREICTVPGNVNVYKSGAANG